MARNSCGNSTIPISSSYAIRRSMMPLPSADADAKKKLDSGRFDLQSCNAWRHSAFGSIRFHSCDFGRAAATD